MEWVTTTQILEQLKSQPQAPAWEQLYQSFYKVIVNFARKMGLSAPDAEDAAQEAMIEFVKAFRAGKYDRQKGRLSHWLFGIARLTIRNYIRRRPHEPVIADNNSGTSFLNQIEDENASHHTWTVEWQQIILERCLQRARVDFDPQNFCRF